MPGARDVVQIPDPGVTGRFIRFSWHPIKRTVVVSHWRNGVCVASTRLDLSTLAPLIAFFARALDDVANSFDAHDARPHTAVVSVRAAVGAAVGRWIERGRSRRSSHPGHPDRSGVPLAGISVRDETIAHPRSA
jgi:hypothetical protein